jgi:hypothetical protein
MDDVAIAIDLSMDACTNLPFGYVEIITNAASVVSFTWLAWDVEACSHYWIYD